MPMHVALAAVLIAIFGALSLLHVYWAFGGSLASAGAVPTAEGQPLFRPGPVACLAVALALAAAAVVCALRAGLIAGFIGWSVPAWIARTGIWAIALVFAARAVGEFRYVGLFKRVHGTVFARRDSLVYSPLCVLIALLAAGLALAAP
jgi:hypothetical protein